MAYDTNNIFSKILRGELGCHKIYENDHVLAFLDIMPVSKGHALVIPKCNSCDLLEIPKYNLHHLIDAVQLVAISAQAAFSPDGISIEQRNKLAAGQEVFHLHFHVIPRYVGIDLMPREIKNDQYLVQLSERYKTCLKEQTF